MQSTEVVRVCETLLEVAKEAEEKASLDNCGSALSYWNGYKKALRHVIEACAEKEP